MSRPNDTEYERSKKPLTRRTSKPRSGEELSVAASTKPPEPPTFLIGEAREAWLRMAKELHVARILVKVSRDKLARYCVAWADWSEAVQDKQATKRPKNWSLDCGYLEKLDTWRKQMSEAERVMQDFEKHYGLTPLSATKIRMPSNVGGRTPEEELDEFLDDETETEKENGE